MATVNVALERQLITLDCQPFKAARFEFELAGLPGACGFMTDTHDIANTTDEEYSDDDLIRLRKLETLLLDRGYARNRHDFWTDAAASTMTAKRKVEP